MTADAYSKMHDFDFLHGSWTVEHRRLRARLVGSNDGGVTWETNWVMSFHRLAGTADRRRASSG